jgi:predicted transcriptional regulator of viral defense system
MAIGNLTKTRFDIAKKDMVRLFESGKSKIYTFTELAGLLSQNSGHWRLPNNLSLRAFLDLLTTRTKLKAVNFEFPKITMTKFVWGEISIFELVASLRAGAYFSHYSAIYLHELTKQVPKAIYFNYEQPKKPAPAGTLQQENIDRAFSCPARITNNVAKLDDYQIYLLSGKQTGRLGVLDIAHNDSQIPVTDTERTLVDATVRPNYSGGVAEVLGAFRKAAPRVSVNKMMAYLKTLDYVYPYHQAIGFYLEKSGAYTDSQIRLVEKFGKYYDFYLVHQIKDTGYSKRWKIYYPKDL